MELESRKKGFISEVKSAVLQNEKGNLFSNLFKKKSDPAEGASLSGLIVHEYRIQELLGSGAIGVVYSAIDQKGNDVAIKVVPTPATDDQTATALFQREVKIGQAIAHPTVVKTLHSFEVGPAQFVVMEKVIGETFRRTLEKKLDVDRYLELFEPLAEGLQAAHDSGVVHRDLKPENVMLTEDGQIKILDFGMARQQRDTSVTATGVFKGTIRYTSPEQVTDSKRAGPQCDQFAFGLMSFEALTGAFPFDIDPKRPMETLLARLDCKPKSLLGTDPSFSVQASDTLAKMLSALPEERFESIKEAFHALRKALKKGS